MLKKALLISMTVLVSSCSVFHTKNECKDTVNSFDESAMVEYKQARQAGLVRNAYLMFEEGLCEKNCIAYDPKEYDFVEMYFNDDKRVGIYTITATHNLDTPNCADNKSFDGNYYCYTVTKNENDVIQSKYKLTINNNNTMILEDLDNKIEVININLCEDEFENTMRPYK